MQTINDRMYEHILKENRPFSNLELLKHFFRIDTEDDDMAGKIVEPLLNEDTRFVWFKDKGWMVKKVTTLDELLLADVDFVLFYIEDLEKRGLKRPSTREELFSLMGEYSSFIIYRGGAVQECIDIKLTLKKARKYVFIPYDRKSLNILIKLYRFISPLQPELKTLSLKALINVLFPQKKNLRWDDIVKEFGIISLSSPHPSSKVRTLVHTFEHVLNVARNRGCKTLGELIDLSLSGRKEVDFSRYGFDRDFLKDIPEMAGVYIFLNKNEKVIYVGKTSNLRVRINSYFWNTGESPYKIEGILENLHTIQYMVLGSDLEALINEYRLINTHTPPFNTRTRIPERVIRISDSILVLPSRLDDAIHLYFLSDTIPLVEFEFECSGSHKEVYTILERMGKGEEYVFDPLKVIAITYIRRYQEGLCMVELSRFASHHDVIEVLNRYCRNRQEVFSEKIAYI